MTDTPPVAPVRPQSRTVHGFELSDPYGWLRADNWREVMRDPLQLAPDIRAYLEQENAFTEANLAETSKLQARLFAEYRGRIKEDDTTVPANDGPFAYFQRYETGGQHPLFCRTPRDQTAPETMIFNADEASKGKAFFQVASVEPSPDHKLACVATDESGAELWTLRFVRIEEQSWFSESIENTSGSFVFLDSQHILYTLLDNEHRPRTVKRHRVGSDPRSDVTVYDEPDPGYFVGLDRTESGHYAVIDAHDHTTSEVRLVPCDAPESEPILVATRDTNVEYDVSHRGQWLVIRTNADQAEDYKLVHMPLSELGKDTARKSWVDLISHEQGRLRLGYCVFENYLALSERVDGLPRLLIYPFSKDGLQSGDEVRFDEEAYSLSLQGSREFQTSVLRFGYSSMTTPGQVFDYDMASKNRVLRKTQPVPSGHDPSRYRSRRIMVPSHDGEAVPVSILHHVETPIDGTAPCYLYGYGAYGHAMPASFGVTRLSLVDRGIVYAIAHVRGGMDRGFRWYKQGKLEHKPNTFLDFIAAGEGLIERGFCAPGKLVAQGGSAGGMLMGAVANMRPDLFRAIVADVPFVDVLNTMLDDALPLTPPEWPEWGNPIENKEAFERIKSYSPYDCVAAQDYPEMLVMAGISDPRVTYWEPAKWVAKLRATKTDDRILLLKTNMDAGHGGASGRFDSLKEVALEQAFLLRSLGLQDQTPRSSS